VDDSNPQAPAPRTRIRPGRYGWAKRALILLPFVSLIGYWLDVPLPVPALLLPERRYMALTRGAELPAAPRYGDAFVVLPDRLVPLPAARESLQESLPDEAVLEPVLRDLEAGLGPFRRARLVLEEPPLAAELADLRKAAGDIPFVVEVRARRKESPVQALGVRYSSLEQRIPFELLLGPAARTFAAVTVRAQKSLLYRSTGTELPEDLVLRLTVDRSEASTLAVTFTDALGRDVIKRLSLGSEREEAAKVLVVSARKPGRSFVEALYPARRVTPAEAAGLDLLSFELVVVDGIPIGSIRGRFLAGLLDLASRRTGSVLFVADSPDFGKKGDNPELEELLPVALLPRSLKDLPDVAVLILIDVSGSMFGDKLSLAKVTGLELLRSLKPTDRVGMMLFSDEHQWVYSFQTNSSITASPVLAPLTAGGGTDLYPALAEGLVPLARQPIQTKHMVLITDGVTKPADFQAFADRARSHGISVSAMGVGADANRPLLERLALQTQGRYYAVNSVDAIPGLLFEDRMSEARAIFGQHRTPVLAMNGQQVASVTGMAQYTALPKASVLFASDVGDPLLASLEVGNRAVLFFGSDLYGTYTKDFFAAPAAVGGFKDRLDALFSHRPAQVRVVESARGLSVLARSDTLVEPVLLLSKEGTAPLETPFRRSGPEGWAAEVVPPLHGLWNASILDRGGSLASFRIAVNGDLGGIRSDTAAALEAYRARHFRLLRLPRAWLLLFFAASLACTVMLRVER